MRAFLTSTWHTLQLAWFFISPKESPTESRLAPPSSIFMDIREIGQIPYAMLALDLPQAIFMRIPLSFSQIVLFCLYPVGPHPLTFFRSFQTQGQCTRSWALNWNYGKPLLQRPDH